MATLDDLAARAGVHKSTVSRAFSQPQKVRDGTRRHILAIAADLGYVPNRIARSLASGRTGNIGFFVHDIGNPISPPSIKAFQAETRQADLTPLLVDRLDGTADDSAVIHAVAQQVDGLVLGQPRMTDEDLLDLAATLPIVLINRTL